MLNWHAIARDTMRLYMPPISIRKRRNAEAMVSSYTPTCNQQKRKLGLSLTSLDEIERIRCSQSQGGLGEIKTGKDMYHD